MIVVEGPDGAGKTRLVKSLAQEFELQVASPGNRDQLWENDVRGRVYSALGASVNATAPPLIHDRLFFSELVYGPVLRKHLQFSVIERRFIWKLFRVIQPPIIMCLPPLEVIEENLQGEHHIPGVVENIEALYEGYSRISGSLSTDKMRWDYTGTVVSTKRDKISRVVEAYIRRRKSRECRNRLPTS